MARDVKDEEHAGGHGAPMHAETAGAPPASCDEAPEDLARGAADGDEQDEPQPKFTLERYYKSRRRQSRSSLGQLAAIVFMLATLVMLLIYKDRCGDAVSGFIYMQSSAPSTKAPVKIRLAPNDEPASRPAPVQR